MNFDFYINTFNDAVSKIELADFHQSNIQLFTGIVLNSVVVKAYKISWTSDEKNPIMAKSRIFFSIWLNDKTIKEKKLCYNIHALKLRDLKGYKISSRSFAADFRNAFVQQEKHWPNVSVNYGPLTLMEGWLFLNNQTLENDIAQLLNGFLTICPLIDKALFKFKI